MSEPSQILVCAEALLEQRCVADAVRLVYEAERMGYDADRCAAGRWMAAMLSGDFAAAWRESDAIRSRGRPDASRCWQGEDLRGRRVILRCLHGFGDAVQMLRYAPRLRALAAHLVVECAPRAAEIVRCLPGIDEVITWGAGAPEVPPQCDIQLEIMELPYIFRSTLADLPIAVNYLSLPPTELDRAASLTGADTGRREVGIVWSSGEWNPARSLPLFMLAPILRRSDCQFWNLQGGAVRNEWRGLQAGTNLRDTAALADGGLVPLAALIAQLDLVVTVDTLAAHVAGALTIPCFLLLQHAADWRWMVGRDDSPWYPSLRLFRQPVPGDWATTVGNVAGALATFAADKCLAQGL